VKARADKYSFLTKFNVAVGTGDRTCCTVEHGLSAKTKYKVFSASKMVTAYVLLSLVKEGKLSLSTKASEKLHWWTKSAGDKRSKVTVAHLLSNTDGFPTFKKGMGYCESHAGGILACAKEAYNLGVTHEPGSNFLYSETSFYLAGAVAMGATGLTSFDAIFQQYVAKPLGMRGCSFGTDPGADLTCSTTEYAKFLRAVTKGKGFKGAELYKTAEAPMTKSSPMSMPMGKLPDRYEYGLGLWRMCTSDNCQNDPVVYIHSMGAQGFIPSIYRPKGKAATWLIIGHNGGMTSGFAPIQKGLEITRWMQSVTVPGSTRRGMSKAPTGCDLGCNNPGSYQSR